MPPIGNGLQAVFGAAFAAFYTDGVLHKTALTDDGTDGFAAATTDIPVKVLAESLSDRDRAAGGFSHAATRLSVLRAGLAAEIALDDGVTVGAATWRVVQVDTDPVGAVYSLIGVPA